MCVVSYHPHLTSLIKTQTKLDKVGDSPWWIYRRLITSNTPVPLTCEELINHGEIPPFDCVWPVLVGQIMIALCSDQLIILIDTVSYLSHWANDTNWKYGQVFAIGKEWSVNMSVSDADWLWSIPTVYFFFLGISLWEKWGIYHSGEPLKIWLGGRKGRKKRVVVMVVTRSQYMQTTISSCGTYWGNHITHFC